MNKLEAKAITQSWLDALRLASYSELEALLGNDELVEITGDSGTVYQLKIDALWDDRRRGHLRVMTAIDDGGWRAFSPLMDGFIIAPDGKFIGE